MGNSFINLGIEEQIALYQQGASVGQIATRLGVSKSTISRRFARHGVVRRTQSEAIYLSIELTGKRGGRPRAYKVNEAFFDMLTPISAYVIGFIQADGTIGADRFSITVKKEDTEFLACIAQHMGSDRPLQAVQHPYGEVVRLAINSSHMSSALRAWGIHSPRTFTAYTHADLLGDCDYWRGVIDGDGSLCLDKRKRKILRLVGSRTICQQFLDFAKYHGCGKKVGVYPCKRIFTVCFNGNEAIALASILYRGATLFLPRKMAIFLKHFSTQQEGETWQKYQAL